VQPTDDIVRSVFVFLNAKAARRKRYVPRVLEQGLVVAASWSRLMRVRIINLVAALSAIAALALAGGASLRGF
jgi:hypothetical protein